MERNTVDAKRWLCCSKSVPAYSTVKCWFVEFRGDQTSTNDAPRLRSPQEAMMPENIVKIHEILLGDCEMKLSVSLSQDNTPAHTTFNTTHKYKE